VGRDNGTDAAGGFGRVTSWGAGAAGSRARACVCHGNRCSRGARVETTRRDSIASGGRAALPDAGATLAGPGRTGSAPPTRASSCG
jgi:hypothetical protein